MNIPITPWDFLEGRALDEACAKAMGCRFGMPPDKKCIKCGWIDPSVGCIARCGTWPDLHARGYGTDATHIPEMLAWLMQFADVETVSWRDLTVEAATINSDRHRVDARRRGATIQQALARLVVEVAEQQMKGAK